ncbi:MAG TPA: PAS domain S-box protein [Longimicrobiales bacterium]
MRNESSRRESIRLPLILVVLSLVSLLVVPPIIQSRISRLHREITDVMDPAVALVPEIESVVAVEAANVRAWLLTADARYAAARQAARARRLREYEQLLPLARRIGSTVHAGTVELDARIRMVEARVDSLFAGSISRAGYLAGLPEQQARFTAISTTASRIEADIGRALLQRRAAVNRLGLLSNGLTVAFALLALLAVLQVARLGRGYRRLVDRLDTTAQRQRALREVAAELSAAVSVEDAVDAIVRSAVATTRAFGAYVERADAPEPDAEVEVIAVAGKGVPAIGTRVPYPGSLTEATRASDGPQILAQAGAIGERLASYRGEICRGCSGLIAPLSAGADVLGALVLLRSPEQAPFSREEATYVSSLADLASTALRRVLLVEALGESEARFRQITEHLQEAIWLSDPGYRELYYANPAYERIWGRSPRGTPAEPRARMVAVHPADRARAEAALEDLPRGEYDIEYRIYRPDGQLRWVRSRGYPIRNERGEVYRVTGITEDITDRKRAEEERERLLASERAARERVTSILESITDAFFAVDHAWRFTCVNHEAERLFRRSREELLGRNLWEEIPEAASETAEREYRTALEEHSTVAFEEYYPALDTWVDVRAYPADDGLSIFFRDVTARKRAEEKLRESEELFRQIAENIREVIWISDPELTERYFMSPAYEEVWGRSRESALEHPESVLEAIHPEDRARVEAELRRMYPRGEYDSMYRIIKPDGEVRWVRSRGYPIRDERGRIYRIVGLAEDITEHRLAEAERERLLEREQAARAEAERGRDELRRVTESRNRLMRGFSHDVKNPLGAADGYLQLLEEGVLDHLTPKQTESVGSARRSIAAALDLIDDLLEFARAEAGEIEFERAPTDVRDVAHDAAAQYRAQAEAQGLDLTVEAPDTVPVIESDANRVRQILGNLLSNAVKYTERGSITMRLDVREGGNAPGPGRWIAIDVADTGPGIPEDQIKLLFQEFRRLDQTGQRKGAGIGLAISRRVARALGGDITVESEVGKGSTFTLWLPAEPADERPAGERRTAAD